MSTKNLRFLGREGYSLSSMTLTELMGPNRVVVPLILRFHEVPPEDFQVGVAKLTAAVWYEPRFIPVDLFAFFELRSIVDLSTISNGEHINLTFFRENPSSLRVIFGTDTQRADPVCVQIPVNEDSIIFRCEEKYLNSGLIELVDTSQLLIERPTFSSECLICQESKRKVVLVPCGHFSYCLECAKTKRAGNNCVVCSRPVEKQVIVNFRARRCMECVQHNVKCEGVQCLSTSCGCATFCANALDSIQACGWCHEIVTSSQRIYDI